MQPSFASCGDFLPEESFIGRVHLEIKRTERSRRPFVLMLLESTSLFSGKNGGGSILTKLSHSTRETDIRGWYKNGSVIGIMFTEIGASDGATAVSAIESRIGRLLSSALSAEQGQLSLTFHVFPEAAESLTSQKAMYA